MLRENMGGECKLADAVEIEMLSYRNMEYTYVVNAFGK